MYLMLSYLGSGFLLALPLGPVGIKVLSTLAQHGRLSSRYAFAGMILGELAFVLLAIGLYQWQASMFPQAVIYLQLVSAITMIIFGVLMCRTIKPPSQLIVSSPPSSRRESSILLGVGVSNWRFFLHTLLITLANPMILLIYLSAWTSMQDHFTGQIGLSLLAMSFFMVGGALWPQMLIFLLEKRQQFLKKIYKTMSWITGLGLILYGGFLIWVKIIRVVIMGDY